MTGIAELRALGAAGRIVRGVLADRWHAATPAPAGTRALVSHLVSGNLWAVMMRAATASGGALGTSTPASMSVSMPPG